MKTIHKSNALASGLQDFFADHLPRLRGMSPHIVRSEKFKAIACIFRSRHCERLREAIQELSGKDLDCFAKTLAMTKK